MQTNMTLRGGQIYYLYTPYAEKNNQKLNEPEWHKFV